MAAEREIGLDPLLQRREAQVLEPPGFQPRERLAANSASAGPRQSASASRRSARRARRVALPRLRDQRLEAQQVELVRLDSSR